MHNFDEIIREHFEHREQLRLERLRKVKDEMRELERREFERDVKRIANCTLKELLQEE